jgi:hypothetical protein
MCNVDSAFKVAFSWTVIGILHCTHLAHQINQTVLKINSKNFHVWYFLMGLVAVAVSTVVSASSWLLMVTLWLL